jgi:hypothetical protein
MNPLALVKIFAPLVMDKIIQEKFTEKPTVVGGEKVSREYEEKLIVNKKKASGWASLIVAILMSIAVNQGWLTEGQADLVDDVLENKVEQLIEKSEAL